MSEQENRAAGGEYSRQPHPWGRSLCNLAVVLAMLLLLLAFSTQYALPYLAVQSSGEVPLVSEQTARVDIAIKQNGKLNEDVVLNNGLSGLQAAVYNKSTKENPGAVPAYVRAALVPIWRNQDGTGNGRPVGEWTINLDGDEYRMGEVTMTLVPGWNTPDKNGRYWSYQAEDGYFYYHGALEPGEATSPLLQDVSSEGKGKLEVQIVADGIETAGDGLPAWAAICRAG